MALLPPRVRSLSQAPLFPLIDGGPRDLETTGDLGTGHSLAEPTAGQSSALLSVRHAPADRPSPPLRPSPPPSSMHHEGGKTRLDITFQLKEQ